MKRNIHAEWQAEVKYTVKPRIKKRKTIGGVLHYITDTGKLYVADIFDRMFGTITKASIKPQSYKGQNPSRFLELMNS